MCYRYKYYERWATAHDFPVENIVNDGTTTVDTRYMYLPQTPCCSMNIVSNDDSFVEIIEIIIINYSACHQLEIIHSVW